MNQPSAAAFTNPQPALQQRLRSARVLLLGMLVLSLATLAAAFVLRGNATEVNWVVWVRAGAVAAGALWFLALLSQTQRGQPSAYRRLRLLCSLVPIGIVLIIVAPDSGYPVWMKWEQGAVGLLLLGVAVVLWQRRMRDAFPGQRRPH